MATPSASSLSREQAINQAAAAFGEFGGNLKAELEKAIASGGPVAAVDVCRTLAPELARQHSERVGFSLGRSSHKWRNPDNAPTDELRVYLAKHSEAGAEAPVEAFAQDDGWLVVAPIVTAPVCLTCHGDPKTFSNELQQALHENYPEDRAVGFKVGDLRGIFWAKLP